MITDAITKLGLGQSAYMGDDGEIIVYGVDGEKVELTPVQLEQAETKKIELQNVFDSKKYIRDRQPLYAEIPIPEQL